jgi:hypothetical protein
MPSPRFPRIPVFLIACAALGWPASAQTPDADGLRFFESRIRPVLVDRCFQCHSAESEKLKGGLRLDSRDGALKGGDTRGAIVPGHPEKSLLIEAIRYSNVDLQMPPKGRLTPEQTADFTAWIQMGAPWPASKQPAPASAPGKAEFAIGKRRAEHWAWQPVLPRPLPKVADADWSSQPVDRFLLARLEAAGLSPAPPADKRTLIRRLYFDLAGLPPPPETVEPFLADESPDAFDRLADRLLASPQFGERWARHWLDLVRYAETLGHEFDYTMPGAWRYRDYIIRAFNTDVPYDQLVLEHIAGDTLAHPRTHPVERFNESMIGTGFFWLGQQSHSPVDVRLYQSDVIANQIDVMTKTFLGLTVACARCHDHKFDAISTKDFYSLYGILGSSRYAQRSVDSPETFAPQRKQLASLKTEIRSGLSIAWAEQAGELRAYLAAAREVVVQAGPPASLSNAVSRIAGQRKLETAHLKRWTDALLATETTDLRHPLYAWRTLAMTPANSNLSFSNRWTSLLLEWRTQKENSSRPATSGPVFADFSKPGTIRNWLPDGEAFGEVGGTGGDFVVGTIEKPVSMIAAFPCVQSAGVSRRFQGVLRSRDFPIEQRYIHVLAAGRGTRFNLCVDNFTLIRDPIYGGLKKRIDREDWHWITVDAEMWKGHRAYLEFLDQTVPDPSDDGRGNPEGYFAISRVLFSDDKTPPPAWAGASTEPELLGSAAIDSSDALDDAYARAMASAAKAWDGNGANPAQLALLHWLAQHDLFTPTSDAGSPAAKRLAASLDGFRRIEASIPEPVRVPAMAEGNGSDESVFIRGNPKTPGETVHRRFLESLGGPVQTGFDSGSGRAELARRMIDPSNPLLARVMVNRVWQHLFGRGIVPTPDDFGVLGQPPSHPELLDWLAGWYRSEAGYSTKKLIRLLVTSSAYRMSGKPSNPASEQKDPANLLWHRMPVRRLEGEAIRDAMLAISGRLDPAMFGPPVPVHLTPFMEGRGRPGTSGPEDGAGRRSLYLEVRRNFPSPLMRAFDAPVPFTTAGSRTVSNVPAQSLILMNDPFVLGQAQLWARRILAGHFATPEERITAVYQAAFSRPPTVAELAAAAGFLRSEQAGIAASGTVARPAEAVWTDLCHVIFNVKEFVFVN